MTGCQSTSTGDRVLRRGLRADKADRRKREPLMSVSLNQGEKPSAPDYTRRVVERGTPRLYLLLQYGVEPVEDLHAALEKLMILGGACRQAPDGQLDPA